MKTLQSAAELTALAQTNPLFIAYFSHKHCNVCEALKPKISALLARLEIEGVYVDTEALKAVAGQHLVLAVPTLIIFQMGRPGERFGRHLSMHQLEATLTRAAERLRAILEADEA
ncbi:thioredoxin family protein [Myxococcota bacterium]|nr:thioredoxin family protein [Myxococcota bacterium]MBU1429057.1 thioredoxin family protein [Myxococcota bacterium]MBU1899438.1 thioredoxin family protein [Myxococcota bacterium]